MDDSNLVFQTKVKDEYEKNIVEYPTFINMQWWDEIAREQGRVWTSGFSFEKASSGQRTLVI